MYHAQNNAHLKNLCACAANDPPLYYRPYLDIITQQIIIRRSNYSAVILDLIQNPDGGQQMLRLCSSTPPASLTPPSGYWLSPA